jgi:hypothetical protein
MKGCDEQAKGYYKMERIEASSTNPGGMRVTGAGQITRPARVLLGWLEEQDGCMMLSGRNVATARSDAHLTRVSEARGAVSNRSTGLDQSGTISAPPDSLADHIAAVVATDSGKEMVAEGWTIQIADLRKVLAVQPAIHFDHARERTVGAKNDDLLSVATISLPLPSNTNLPAQFDDHQKTWVISSRNPNLRIVGNFNAPAGPGMTALGFIIRVLPSFVQVVKYRGKYVLRDGYHRSLGFLSRGINSVPVFYREFGPYEELGLAQGMLTQAAYLGDRPPVLPDYLADDVSVEVALPATQRMIVISGLETNPIG